MIMARKKQDLEYTFILKLSRGDREKLNALQDNGVNMSAYFRHTIRTLYDRFEAHDEYSIIKSIKISDDYGKNKKE